MYNIGAPAVDAINICVNFDSVPLISTSNVCLYWMVEV